MTMENNAVNQSETQEVVFAQPDANEITTVSAEQGQSIVLDISKDDIETIGFNSDGELVIVFQNEGVLIVENAGAAEGIVSGGAIKLTEGGSLDVSDVNGFAALQEQSTSQVADAAAPSAAEVANIQPAAGAEQPLVINQPAANQEQTLELQAGQEYQIGFAQDQIQAIEQQGEALVITFGDGGSLVIPNFEPATTAEDAASILNQTGNAFSPSDVQQFLALGQQFNDIEPAAGEGAGTSNTGFGFGSTFQSTDFAAPDAIGPINPTALEYPFPDIPEIEIDDELVQPDLEDPTISAPDQVVFEDGSLQLAVTATPASPGDQLTVSISGIDPSWTVDTSLVGGTFDPATGVWSAVLPQGAALAFGPTLSPPADSDADLTGLTFSVTATQVATGETTTVSDPFNIITDAVIDDPDLVANDASGAEDTAIPLDITTAATDTDGSESITNIVISGVPAGASLSAGTDLGGGQFQLTQAELVGLTLTPPTDFSGSIPLSVTVTATETSIVDGEVTLTNNETTVTDPLKVTVGAVADEPFVEVADAFVKEDGSVQLAFQAGLNDTDGSEQLTVSISGIDPTWAVDTTASGGTFDAATGVWTLTLPAGEVLFEGGPTFSPPADSDADLTGLTVTATATELSNGDTASASDTASIFTDAVIDAPVLTANDVTGDEDNPIDLDIATATGETTGANDGSEEITNITISGVPAGASLSAGTDLGGGQYELTSADLIGLQLNPPANFNGTINLSVSVTSTEVNLSGDEQDFTDNEATVTDEILVTVNPQADDPIVEARDLVVKEDGSVDIDVTAELTGPPTDVLTVSISGIDPAWTVDTTTSGGTFDPATGVWTITLPPGENFSGGPTVSPPADSDADLTGLVVTVVESDPLTGTDGTAMTGFDIITDAVIDDPTLVATNGSGLEDTPIDLDITTATGETTGANDGSEEITNITISGVPAGASLSAGTDLGGGQYELTLAELTGLQLNPPTNFSGTINLTVSVTSTEVNLSGTEVDFTDNETTVTTPLEVVVTPDADAPELQVEDALVKEDNSVALQVSAQLVDTDGSEFLTISIAGIDSAWGVDTTTSGGTFDAATGVWTITLPAGENFSGGPTLSPPADSDVDLDGLIVTATSTEVANGDAASVTDTLDVNVDAVIDAPTLDADDADVEQGSAVDLVINTATGESTGANDGSEEITNITISGIPTGATLSAGTDLGGGQFELTPADLVGLQIITQDSLAEGDYTLTVSVTSTEVNLSGDEVDFTDNQATVTDELVLQVGRDDEPVIIEPNVSSVDETNFDVNDPLTVSGEIRADFFSDDPGTITPTGGPGSFTSSTSLSSGGVAVTSIALNAAGTAYEGRTDAGDLIFSLTVTDSGNSETATHTFQQFAPLDHPDTADANDAIVLTFDVTATDSDGDTDTGTVTINVFDDGPEAPRMSVFPVSEENIDDDGVSVTRDFRDNPDFGEDGAGQYEFNGTVDLRANSSLLNGVLSSGGDEIRFEFTDNLITGYTTDVADPVFTVSIDPATGQHTFTLFQPLDHADADETGRDDVIWLKIGVDVVDADGDRDSTIIQVDVRDDGLEANDDLNTFTTNVIEGDVISGENGGPGAADDLSADDTTPGTDVLTNSITHVAFGNTVVDVPETGVATIQGEFGTLEIAANGDYEYTLNANAVDATETQTETVSLNPTANDVVGETSFTNNGITISSGSFEGRTTELTFETNAETGSGVGVGTEGIRNSDRVFSNGEFINVALAEAASKLTFTIAEIGQNNFGDGLDYNVYLESDPTTPIQLELQLPNFVADGIVTFEVDVNDIAPGDAIVGVDLFSVVNSNLGRISFLLNNVEAEFDVPAENDLTDVFTYTIQDFDGDKSEAYLVLNRDVTVEDEVFIAENNNADTFVIDDDGGTDLIVGFNGNEGDTLDISSVLQGFDPLTDALSDFVQVDVVGNNTEVQVNTGGQFETVAILNDAVNFDLNDIVTQNTAGTV